MKNYGKIFEACTVIRVMLQPPP